MKVLIVYGTTEGHTHDLCGFIGEQLRGAGHTPTICKAGPGSQPDPEPFDAIVLAASLHLGRYQAGLTHYARANHATLNAKPSAFVSVSLSAAGEAVARAPTKSTMNRRSAS